MKYLLLGFFSLLGVSCLAPNSVNESLPDQFVVVLGITQDAGYPQIGCEKDCCKPVWEGHVAREKVISLGLVDRSANKVWIIDATPDFKDQLRNLLSYLPNADINSLGGIFLTHAHIGHYTGLMQLGHEAMGAKDVPVYVMPRMKSYLETSGPWSQLVDYKNISIEEIADDSLVTLSQDLSIMPMLVPHRDEFSETVGYKVWGQGKKALFIPDIDKWQKWNHSIIDEVGNVDYAFLDAVFYSDSELPNRNMSEIPHPFVSETIELFKSTEVEQKDKIIFIHMNHTNPLMHNGSEYRSVIAEGFKVGRERNIYPLSK